MRIVIDTNVLISGVFFGGYPRKILSSIVSQNITACASAEIINEYEEIVQEMIDRKQGHIEKSILSPLIAVMEIIEPITRIEICRDPDDNKHPFFKKFQKPIDLPPYGRYRVIL